MTELRPIRTDGESAQRYVALFRACFPMADKFNLPYLQWLYQQNPAGPALGFDAWDGDRLAAHYAAIPLRARLNGETVRALLSLNTATHPDYQGRGLFTRLAERTYEAAAQAAFSAVVGVANANSTPGFTRKLGFQLVEPLWARVGVGPLGIDFAAAEGQRQFHALWQADTLAWRCSNPNNPVQARRLADRWQLRARAMGSLLSAVAELPSHGVASWQPSGSAGAWPAATLHLYLGLEPAAAGMARRYVRIPQRWRPSPLNFIYRPLSTAAGKLEPGHVSFSFLDFDAY